MQALSEARAVVLDDDPDLDRGPKRAILLMVMLVVASLVGGLLWMSYAALDISVNAYGAVIPSNRVQEIQSLEGGIVGEVVVREGQQVRQGDLLVQLESAQFASELAELRQRYWGYLANIARLDAEIAHGSPVFPEEIVEQVPGLIEKQKKLWAAKTMEQRAAMEGAESEFSQRRQELVEANSKMESVTRNLTVARERFQFLLHKRGEASEFLNAKKEVSQLEGELASLQSSIPRLESAIEQAQARINEIRSRYRTEASVERSDLEAKATAASELLTGHEDKVKRQSIVAPMDGIVNRVLIATRGGVAKPGESILELIPIDDRLLVKVEVEPQDIAFVKIGQSAQVRISAYDAAVFGGLQGTVVQVGADALVDEHKDRTFFEVNIETEQNFIHAKGKDFPISPGMTADVSILTGERTLLEYMLKPIFRTFDTALQER